MYLDYLSKIPKDKLLHYIVGTFLGLVGLYNWWLGLAVVVVVAIGKEIYDIKYKGTPEVNDAFATILGGLSTLIVIIL